MRYENEKERVEGLREYKKRLEGLQVKAAQAERDRDLATSGRPPLRRHSRDAEEDRDGGGSSIKKEKEEKKAREARPAR